MTDGAYRLAVAMGTSDRAARRAAALAKIAPALARVRAMRRLRGGLGLAVLPGVVERASMPRGGQERGSGDRGDVMPLRVAAVARSALARAAAANLPTRLPMLGGFKPPMLAAVNDAVGSGSAGRPAFAWSSRSRSTALCAAVNGVRSAGGSTGRVLRSAAMASAGAGARLAVPVVARLATRAPGWDTLPVAAPAREQASAPGFHRTVRHGRAQAAAGDVYLDKALVGQHLAAAITAEQTRAAGRPNISGAGFNSSMAVLRPSGAGL